MKYALMCVAALSLAVAPLPAHAQQQTPPSQIKPSSEFIKAAAEDDMAEVDLGNLAKQKAQSQAVKQLANRLVTDHENNETQVRELASKENVTLPSSVNEKDKALKDHLQGLSGAHFDQEYVKAMVEGHQKSVAEFEVAAKQAADPQVQMYAQKTLPVLEQHLKLAQDAQNSVVGTSGKK